MLHGDRNAVIYGGGGSIGGAVARALAREGATVHLAARTRSALEAVAANAGGIDISFNAISHNSVHGAPLAEIAVDGSGDPIRDYYIGGTQVAFEAIEQLRRQRAVELGQHGIRVVTLRTGGIPESLPDDMPGRDAIVETMPAPTTLGRTATLEDVGNVAAFVASDRARTLTAAAVNISCGALID